MYYLSFLCEILIALLLLKFMFGKVRKWLLKESISEKVEATNILAETTEEVAKKVKPITEDQKKAVKKINDHVKDGDKLK